MILKIILLACFFILQLFLVSVPLFIKLDNEEDEYDEVVKLATPRKYCERPEYLSLTLDNEDFYILYEGKYIGHGSLSDFVRMKEQYLNNFDELRHKDRLLSVVRYFDECKMKSHITYKYDYEPVYLLGKSDPVYKRVR